MDPFCLCPTYTSPFLKIASSSAGIRSDVVGCCVKGYHKISHTILQGRNKFTLEGTGDIDFLEGSCEALATSKVPLGTKKCHIVNVSKH